MSMISSSGVGLEARAQRLFIAQGIFAERHLFPSASPARSMVATDIDVLVSEYVSGFHLTRRHAECKGGKPRILDRILWLSGVRRLLNADSTYLIVPDFNTDASEFAQSLDIQLLTIKQLEGWEAEIPVPQDVWPCRSDYQSYDIARNSWRKLSSNKNAEEDWGFLREAFGFLEIDSWVRFRYRHLNKLLRLIEEMAREYQRMKLDRHRELCSRYLFSALLVRFCQYLLAICYDVTRLPVTEIESYLYQHLIYGDQDPKRTSELIDGTIGWIKQSLAKNGLSLPPEIDIGRLYEPPTYAAELLELVNRLLQKSNESRYLPIAMETLQFGTSEAVNKLARLKVATTTGGSLAALVKGFVIRAFSVSKNLTAPLSDDLRATYCQLPDHSKKSQKQNQAQLPM